MAVMVLLLGCTQDAPDSGKTVTEIMETPEFEEACAAAPTCVEPRFQSSGPSETIWRIQIIREASGKIRFGHIDSIEVTQGRGVPMGPATGAYLLAGVDASGVPVDGQVIQFPSVALVEYLDRAAPLERVDLSGERGSTTGYLRALPSIDSLILFDEAAKPIVMAPRPSTRLSIWNSGLPFHFSFVAPAMAQGVINTSSCSHVHILSAGDFSLVENPLGVEELVTPQHYQLVNILEALGRMTPLLCQSISTLAFGDFGSSTLGMVNTLLLGDIMMVNSAAYTETMLTPGNANEPFRSMDLQQTILHEAGHAAEALLNSEGLDLDTFINNGGWSPIARVMANEVIKQVRLKAGFGDEWSRVHDSFVDQGWATDYYDLASVWGLNQRQVTRSGFMSPYGSSNHADDIAEAIGWTYMGRHYPAKGVAASRRDFGCMEMAAHGDKSIPAHLAAIYTKLHFLRDVGLIASEDVSHCKGSGIGIPITVEGFESWEGGVKKHTYSSGVEAGIGTKSLTRAKVFTMKAEGVVGFGETSYPAKFELHLDLESTLTPIEFVPWPRGVYQLGASFWEANKFTLRAEDAASANWDADQGFVLVTEASSDRIVGSIFLTRVLRVSTPSPLPVYDAFNPPRVLRFLVKK
ncbi:MAG: hypothetical protein ACSLE2_00825 [Lysobacterales bacterium]